MSDVLETVTDADFAQIVEASPLPYLLEFTSPMCAPCAALAPVLAEVADEWAPRMRVGQIDIAEQPETTTRFAVMTTPTMILFKDGQPVRRLMGSKNKRNLLEALGEFVD